MPGSKVGVLPLGHHVRLESLLYGLLLPSGNDAAVALAQHVAGSVNSFVARMNERGRQARARLHALLLALRLLRRRQLLLRRRPRRARPRRHATAAHRQASSGTYAAVLPFPIKGGKLYLYNNNPLLIYKYPGVTGMKTGQTEAAGRCLVATAERHGVRLGAIVLNSDAPGTQARQLLDLGFERRLPPADRARAAVPAGRLRRLGEPAPVAQRSRLGRADAAPARSRASGTVPDS